MRLSRITCCTISALLGSGVAAQANDDLNEHQPKSTDFDEQPDLNFSHPGEKYQVSAAVIPSQVSRIVPPETHFSSLKVLPSATEITEPTTVAIAPETENVVVEAENTIRSESPEFISEFEWTAATPATEVEVTEPISAEVDAPPEIELNSSPQSDEIALVAANIDADPSLRQDIDVNKLFLNHNQQFEQDIHARPVADFMTEETEAIAKQLPEVAESEMTESETTEIPPDTDFLLAQNQSTQGVDCKPCTPVEPLMLPEIYTGVSPALSINIPVGFGADQNTVFLSSTFQAVTRTDNYSTFHSGIGVGLGNASEGVGFELSYSQDTDAEFGDGGFNAKLHKRFTPDFAGSLGWNGFLNTGRNDYEHSLYGALTKVFRTRESLDKRFSRVAVTAGVGTNQLRSDAAVRAGNNDINAFGNITVRVARPVSFITEWSGQDLGVGLSIAPFENFPLVITPAIRDIFDGNGSRFVLGVGLAKKF